MTKRGTRDSCSRKVFADARQFPALLKGTPLCRLSTRCIGRCERFVRPREGIGLRPFPSPSASGTRPPTWQSVFPTSASHKKNSRDEASGKAREKYSAEPQPSSFCTGKGPILRIEGEPSTKTPKPNAYAFGMTRLSAAIVMAAIAPLIRNVDEGLLRNTKPSHNFSLH